VRPTSRQEAGSLALLARPQPVTSGYDIELDVSLVDRLDFPRAAREEAESPIAC
jgi:hypothetical protein